jgi:hypothetical protein
MSIISQSFLVSTKPRQAIQPTQSRELPPLNNDTSTDATQGHTPPHKPVHEHDKETPKTLPQRLASLGTGVLLTSAVSMLAEAEQQTGSLKKKSSALLSTDVGTWVKSLGLLAGVQGINAGLGLHLPPVINALELGAVSHVLIPGTLGSRTAHFLTMAPLLAASVGVTQAAHTVINQTVDKNENLTEQQQEVTKALLGLGVSVGAGIGAMALFPKMHLGLAALGLKLHPNTASAEKQAENWYITTTKTVDGLAYATKKAWQSATASITMGWQKLTHPNGASSASTSPLFSWKRFRADAEAPWNNEFAIYPPKISHGEVFPEPPEVKLYRLQKIDTKDLTLYRQPTTFLEKAWHLLTGNQSATAHAFLSTQWDAKTRMPIAPQAFGDIHALKQFEWAYLQEIMHLMRGEDYANAVTALETQLKGLATQQPVDGALHQSIQEEAPALLAQLLGGSVEKPSNQSPLLLEYKLFKPHYDQLKAVFFPSKEPHNLPTQALSEDAQKALRPYFEALRPFFESEAEYKATLTSEQRKNIKWHSAIDSDLHKTVLLTDWLNQWQAQHSTRQLHPNSAVDELVQAILAVGQHHNASIGSTTLANDLTIIKERYLPLIKKLNEQGIDFRDEGSRATFQQQVLAQLGGETTPEADLFASRLTQLLSRVDHIKFHIPDVPTFWAITGAAAGAVTCGNGCCSGSFFCLNEATALAGSLLGALAAKLGWHSSEEEESEKKKQKAKV